MQYANNVRLAPFSLSTMNIVKMRASFYGKIRSQVCVCALCKMRNGKCKLNKGGTCSSRRVDRLDCQVLFLATTIRIILRGRHWAASRDVLTTPTAPRNKKKNEEKRISRNAKKKKKKSNMENRKSRKLARNNKFNLCRIAKR